MGKHKSASADSIMTIAEVAKGVSVHKDSVFRWIASGELTAVDVGSGRGRKCYRVWKSDLLRFLEARQTKKVPTKSKAVSRLPKGEAVGSYV